jgi:pimeloyl-ACP methyl ester carboxylesterase
VELVLLHALPLDGSMWRRQARLIPGGTHAPTLYGLGETLSEWAAAVLDQVHGDRLIVVGNSVGGSCALEMAVLAPDRIAALVLVEAKAGHRPEPDLHQAANAMLRDKGVEAAWDEYWAPLFAPSSAKTRADARRIATRLSAEEIASGVTGFHTRVDRADLLPTLSCPILCICGDHCGTPGLAKMTAQANAASDGRLIIIPDCGHYVPMEQPDALNAILRSLIDELT